MEEKVKYLDIAEKIMRRGLEQGGSDTVLELSCVRLMCDLANAPKVRQVYITDPKYWAAHHFVDEVVGWGEAEETSLLSIVQKAKKYHMDCYVLIPERDIFRPDNLQAIAEMEQNYIKGVVPVVIETVGKHEGPMSIPMFLNRTTGAASVGYVRYGVRLAEGWGKFEEKYKAIGKKVTQAIYDEWAKNAPVIDQEIRDQRAKYLTPQDANTEQETAEPTSE